MQKQQDQRIRTTKALVRQGLISLLAQKPVRDITVTELCSRSGINRGTFYAHYRDIEDLLCCVEEEVFHELYKALIAHPAHPSGFRIGREQTIYSAVFTFFSKRSDMCSLLMNSQAYGPLMEKMLKLGYEIFETECLRLHPGQAQEQIRLAYAFVAAGFLNLLKEWITAGCREPEEEMAHRTELLVLACIKA